MEKKATVAQSIILLLVSISAIIAYSPSINGGYFCDDYQFKFHDIKIDLKSVFTPSHIYAYRPVEKLFLAIMQQNFPQSTWPIHTTLLLLHLMLSALLMVWLRREGFTRSSSIIAFTVMVLSQANTYAVSSLDTFSQITSTLFGYSSIVFFLGFIRKESNIRYFLYAGSIILSLFAVFCKENAMFIVPILFALVLIFHLKHKSDYQSRLIPLLISLIPYLIICIVFMLIRKHLNLMPAEIGPGKFNIGLGPNILKNFFMSLVQAIQPHSSVDLYLDIANNRWLNVAVVLFTSAFLVIITIRGIFISRLRNFSLVIIALLPLSMFPVILLNEINELYVYNMMPLVAILLGIGFEETYNHLNHRFLKKGLLCFFSGFLIWNSVSVHSKCRLMKENGIKSEQIHRQIDPYYSQIPERGALILVNPNTSKKTEYSIFKRTGFRVVQFGGEEFVRRSGRNDFRLQIIMENQLDSIDTSNSLVLRYKDGIVGKIGSPGNQR